ncbi:hypothetical protein CU098_005808, partial [Rhizopus stolonifer]
MELIKDHCFDISKEELKAFLLIVNSLAPYSPLKDVSYMIIHQLPFVMLANDLLEVTDYQKFTRKVCPMPSDDLHLFDYDDYIIDSEKAARRHQDEMFKSVFDMEAIYEVCKSYKLNFSRSITIVSGLVTVRLLLEKHGHDKLSLTEERSKYIQALNSPEVVKELEKNEAIIKEEINDLQNKSVSWKMKQKLHSKKKQILNIP